MEMKRIIITILTILLCQDITISQIAVADVEKINEFIEKKINSKLGDFIEFERKIESLKSQNLNFFEENYDWILKRHQGGCLSLAESKMMEKYLNYLQKEIIKINEDLDEKFKNCEEKINNLIWKEIKKNIELQLDMYKIKMIINAEYFLFKDDSGLDLTDEIIISINDFNTDELESTIKEISLEINDKMELLDYYNYKEIE